MKLLESKSEIRRAVLALASLTAALWLIMQFIVVPAVKRWPALHAIAVLGCLAVLLWTHCRWRAWTRHLEWCEEKREAERMGDTITLLGLMASPYAARPKLWPAFWWRLWGFTP